MTPKTITIGGDLKVGRIGLGAMRLSNVSVDQFRAARRIVDIAAVTAHFNVVSRGNAELLRAAADAGAAFSPWQPVSLIPPRDERTDVRPRGGPGPPLRCHGRWAATRTRSG